MRAVLAAPQVQDTRLTIYLGYLVQVRTRPASISQVLEELLHVADLDAVQLYLRWLHVQKGACESEEQPNMDLHGLHTQVLLKVQTVQHSLIAYLPTYLI